MKKLVYVIIILAVAASCNSKMGVSIKDGVIKMPIGIRSDFFELNRQVFKTDTIKLEVSDNCVISHINDVRIADSVIFVQHNAGISMFLYSGEFIRDIIDENDRINHNRFDVNPTKKLVYILDIMRSSILIYTYSGELQRQIPFIGLLADFAVLPDETFLFFYPDYDNRINSGLWRADKDGNLTEQLVDVDNNQISHLVLINHYMVHVNSETVGFMGLEDKNEFYNITCDTIYRTYKLRTRVPCKSKSEYLETDSLLLFDFSDFRSNPVKSIVRKSNNTLFWVYLRNRRDILTDIPVSFDYCYNGYLITSIDKDKIKRFVADASLLEPMLPLLLVTSVQ